VRRFASLLDRIGAAGALLAAIAAPCCSPFFAAATAVAGLGGALGRYEGMILWIFQGFAILTMVGLAFSFRTARTAGPVLLGGIATAALAFHFHWRFSLIALYAGLLGLLAATVWNYMVRTRQAQPILFSTVRCPNCGCRTEETMPMNACVFFFECPGCGARITPRRGDCCVFCSYGSVPCPPIQLGASCCS